MPYEKIGKNEPICIADEVPFEIPESWEWVRLGSVCQLIDGKKLQNKTYNNLDARYMRGKAEAKVLEAGKFVTKGTYLILVDGENSGEVFIAPEDGYMGSTFKILWISAQLYARYVLKFIELYKEPLRNSKKGAAIPHLNKEIFFNLLLPVPSLQEQTRIVDKIVELTPSVERHDLLSRRSDELNRNFPDFLKKSILQYAVQGKLVSQDPTDEPASVLLERICAEKEQLIKSGKIKRDKHESVIFRRDNSYYEKVDGIERCIDDELPFEIPDSWEWCRLSTLAKVLGGKRIPAGRKLTSQNTGYIYIRVSDMKDGTVDKSGLLYVPEDIFPSISKYIINKEDVFITVAGTIGRVGKIPPDLDGANLTENADRLVFSEISQDWLIFALQSPFVQSQILEVTTKVGQPKLAIARIEKLLIALPPFAEQLQISKQITAVYSIIKKL